MLTIQFKLWNMKMLLRSLHQLIPIIYHKCPCARSNTHTFTHARAHQIKSKHPNTNHPQCHRSHKNASHWQPMESVLRFSMKALKENLQLAYLIQLTRPPLVSWSSSSSEEASDLCSMIDKVFDLDNKVKAFKIKNQFFNCLSYNQTIF